MRLEGLCPEQAARLLEAVEIPLSVNMALDTHSMRWQSSRLLGPGVYFAWCDSSQARITLFTRICRPRPDACNPSRTSASNRIATCFFSGISRRTTAPYLARYHAVPPNRCPLPKRKYRVFIIGIIRLRCLIDRNGRSALASRDPNRFLLCVFINPPLGIVMRDEKQSL